jgi:hypothetical protein
MAVTETSQRLQARRRRTMTARERLPNRRPSQNLDIERRFTATVSRFVDRSIAEIFRQNHKAGSAAGIMASDGSIAPSLSLSEMKGRRFQIVRAHSIVVRQNDGQRPVFVRHPIPLMTWCRHGEAHHVRN